MADLLWKTAQDEFASWWTGKTQFCYAFHDTREAMGVSGSRRVYTEERPSDFLVVDNGTTFFAEVKSSQHDTSFALSNIQRGQWRCSIRTCAAGGSYFFYIKREKTQQWHRIPAQFFISLYNEGIKSVKWQDISNFITT